MKEHPRKYERGNKGKRDCQAYDFPAC